MNRSTGMLCLVSMGLVVLAGCAGPQGHFGQPLKQPDAKPLTVTEVLNHVDKYAGEYITVRGTVRDLCAHSGCWMELADSAKDEGDGLAVVFSYDKELGRVPAEAKGREALVEGKLVVKVFSEGERRRNAAEHGASLVEIAKIFGPEKSIRLECPAARIAGVKPVPPKPCDHEE